MNTKITFLVIFSAVMISASAQQMPNGGLDTWTSNVNPDSWADVETLINSPITGFRFTFKDTVDKIQGTASAKLVVDSVPGFGVLAPFLSLGTAFVDTNGISFVGIPFTSRPDTLFFSYKYTSPRADTGAAFMQLTKGDTATMLSSLHLLTSNASWVSVVIPLTGLYNNNDIPDTLKINFNASVAQNPIVGTTLNVDGVRFGYTCAPEAVSLTAGAGIFCLNSGAVPLQGTPSGGSFSGTGVSGGQFAPDSLGQFILAYVYTDSVTHCPYLATDTVSVHDCTGLGNEENVGRLLTIYPNPAYDVFNVMGQRDLSGCQLQLFDVTGNLVSSRVLKGTISQINTSGLSGGTYFYRVFDKENGIDTNGRLAVVK